jgi:hypothetical protein
MAQTTVFAYHAPPSSKCSCPSRSRIGSSRRSLSRGSSLHKTRHTLFWGAFPMLVPSLSWQMIRLIQKWLKQACFAPSMQMMWTNTCGIIMRRQRRRQQQYGQPRAHTHTHTHTHYTALTLAHTHCERHSAEQPDIGNPGRPCPQDLQLPERIERLGLERDAELRRESLPQHAKGEHQLEDVEAPAENAPFFAFSAFPMFVPSLSWQNDRSSTLQKGVFVPHQVMPNG